MTDNEFSVGLDWALELTRDPVVRRNGGLNFHPGSLKSSEPNRAGPGRAGPGRAGPGRAGPGLVGPGRAWWKQCAYPACWCLANTEVVAHGGAGLFGIPNPVLPTGVCDTYGRRAGTNTGTCKRIKGECLQVLPVWCLLPALMPLNISGTLEGQVQGPGLRGKSGEQWLRAVAFGASQTVASLGPITD